METQRILMRSLAVAVVIASVIWTTTAEYNKGNSCCTKVSTAEVTNPIISFQRRNSSPPCVKAVIFETKEGYICSDWRQPWVKRKILQLLKDKPRKQFLKQQTPDFHTTINIIY